MLGRRRGGYASHRRVERSVPLSSVGVGVPVVGSAFRGHVLHDLNRLQLSYCRNEPEALLLSIRPSELQGALPNCMNIHTLLTLLLRARIVSSASLLRAKFTYAQPIPA